MRIICHPEVKPVNLEHFKLFKCLVLIVKVVACAKYDPQLHALETKHCDRFRRLSIYMAFDLDPTSMFALCFSEKSSRTLAGRILDAEVSEGARTNACVRQEGDNAKTNTELVCFSTYSM